jgi:hypothetical protein
VHCLSLSTGLALVVLDLADGRFIGFCEGQSVMGWPSLYCTTQNAWSFQ